MLPLLHISAFHLFIRHLFYFFIYDLYLTLINIVEVSAENYELLQPIKIFSFSTIPQQLHTDKSVPNYLLWPTRLTTTWLHCICPNPSPTTSSDEVIHISPWAKHLQSSLHPCWPSHQLWAHLPIQYLMALPISGLTSLALLWTPGELSLHSTI